MATNRHKAQQFIREMSQAESEISKKLGIDRNDIDVRIQVSIEERVGYNNHEDED